MKGMLVPESPMNHAVVIGGSFAGIVAARVLSDHFAQVTILERDVFPDGPTLRKGVPQGPHVHGILQIGRETLERLFPGFVSETENEGAVLFDQVACGLAFGRTGWSPPRGPSRLRGYGVRRPLLEHVARRRALALPNVDAKHGRATGLQSQAGRVVGVVVGEADGDTSSVIEADLVVDASGRGSAAPGWLERAGFTPPRETVVNGFGGYASRLLTIPEDAFPDGRLYAAQLPFTGCTKGMIIYPQNNERLYVASLFGQSRDYPPADEEGFDAFLAQCATPVPHQIVSAGEPVSEIRTSRATANRWRHYEELSDLPPGFVVVGDAAAVFNPMNGQGISSACLGAVILGAAIEDVDGDLARLPQLFQPRLAERLAFPWNTAVGFDLQFPGTTGDRPAPSPGAEERATFMRALSELATVDDEVNEAFLLSIATFDPSVLTTPAFVSKVQAWTADGREPVYYTDPAHPPTREMLGA